MNSLKKQSEDQLNSKFTVDCIPKIDVGSDRKTLRSTFETINYILRHGENHLKLKCAKRIRLRGLIKDTKQAMKFEKAVIKTKVFGKYLSVSRNILIYLVSQISIYISKPVSMHVMVEVIIAYQRIFRQVFMTTLVYNNCSLIFDRKRRRCKIETNLPSLHLIKRSLESLTLINWLSWFEVCHDCFRIMLFTDIVPLCFSSMCFI